MRIILAVNVIALQALAAGPACAGSKKGFEDHPLNQWVKQSPREGKPAPPFGWEGSGAFDPFSRKWIHFGGHDGIPQGFPLFTFNLDDGNWEQHFPPTSPPGCCCVDGANTFDVANQRFVRFPGAALGHGYQWSRGVKLKSSHVWLYDPATNVWTNMRPAPYAPFLARDGLGSLNACATYDPNHELAISFGGQGSSGGMNNLFAYDAYANRLHSLKADNRPSQRDGSGLAYDAKHDCVVMFGSQYDSDEKTWIYRYETGKWEGHDLEPRPVGKKLATYSTIPKMAFDPLHGINLCITWDTKTNEHETWAFDAGKLTWTKLNPKTEPSPSMSRSRNLSFSVEDNLFILETSSKEGKGKAPEIWTYRYAERAEDKRPAPPRNLRVITAKGKAALRWDAGPGPAAEYHVSRALADEPWKATFKKVGVVKGTSFDDSDLEEGKTFFYSVRAIGAGGSEGLPSFRARTQPRVLIKPTVSALGADKIAVSWNKHPAEDVVGYNVYRGMVLMRAVSKGALKPWSDNDPEYAEPVGVEVRDIRKWEKLNETPLTEMSLIDTAISLAKKEPEPKEYRYEVYAYVVKAVNKLGTESGPSPYALTIPAAPENVLCREKGEIAELKWDASPEKGVVGYHVYKLGKSHWEILRVTDAPIKETTFRHEAGKGTTRYWIVAVDGLGQEGEPSSPVWANKSYKGFFAGEWHQ